MYSKIIKIATLSLVLAFTSIGCGDKKEQPPVTTTQITPIITFVMGDVKRIKMDGSTEALKPGDKCAQTDDVTTGAASFVVFQIQDDIAIRLQANSRISIEALTMKTKVIRLKQGEVLAKVMKLDKTGNFNIKTPTALAAVRGTSFRVSQTNEICTVSVSEGKVEISPIEKENDATQSVVAEPGFTGQKNGAAKIVLRKSTDDELRETKKIAAVPLVQDADKKTPAELNILFKDILESDKAIDGEKKSSNVHDQKQKAIIQKQSGTLTEIKEAFNRLDEITLYNKRVVTGIIISRGSEYEVVTPEGKISVAEKDIKNVRIIR
ncbi:MAG TPA: FecR family protein [Spirochaetota bacterium]